MKQLSQSLFLPFIILFVIGCVPILFFFNSRVERGVKKHFPDPDVQALIVAAHKGDETAVKRLVDAGVDPNFYGNNEATPLRYLMEYDDLAGFTLLLQYGSDPQSSPYRGGPLTYLICHNPDSRYLKACLESGWDPNSTMRSGDTPLHAAIMYPKNVTLLLKHGADVNVKGIAGSTPLFLAVDLNQYCTALTLLEHGADPSILDDTKLSISTKIKKNTSVTMYDRESSEYKCALKMLQMLSKPPYSTTGKIEER